MPRGLTPAMSRTDDRDPRAAHARTGGVRVGAITLGALLAVCGCGSAEQAGAPPTPPPPVRAGSAGVTVELPPGWHSTAANDSNVIDPLARVVVASSPIQAGFSECQTSAYAFAEDAVALVLVEWWGPADNPGSSPPRPARLTSELLSIRRGVHECYPGRSGGLFFSVGDREFGAYVFVGDKAPASLIEDLCAVLDTLEVKPGRPRSGASPTRAEPSSGTPP